jgi:microcystin-dependent protein
VSEPFIGEIRLFAGNFAPRGWAFCDGRRLPIAQNVALFSLLGTMYGGDGRVDFALPNLGGRFPIGAGAGPGLAERVQGEMGGQETVTLLQANLPPHNHTLPATTADATENAPGPGRHPARTREETFAEGAPVATAVTTTPAGAGEPVANMPPALVVSFIIALQGIYPSRG